MSKTASNTNEFQNLGLSLVLTTAVAAAGYTQPTPVQRKAIPPALLGRDLMVAAQTGTGKTASFALPILEKLFCQHPSQSNRSRLRAKKAKVLVLTPTRELAAQVHDSFRTYATNVDLVSTCIFGGVGAQPQVDAMAKGVDVLVACPGRLLDLINQKSVDLSDVEIFVLDEADRMLDMGFIHDVKKVMSRLPARRQNLLYSATFSQDIINLAGQLLNSPERVEVTPPNTTVERIVQAVYHVPFANHKKYLLAHLIQAGRWEQALVFTRTKHGANKLAEFLIKQGIESVAIHGNKSQNARTKALADFKAGSVQIMVATDIAARGLDIDQLPHVVNYELPNVEEDYVHRIGRTGRAGRSGEAVSLVSPDEIKLLQDIQRMTKQTIPEGNLMGFDFSSLPQVDPKAANDRPVFERRGGRGGPAPTQASVASSAAPVSAPAASNNKKAKTTVVSQESSAPAVVASSNTSKPVSQTKKAPATVAVPAAAPIQADNVVSESAQESQSRKRKRGKKSPGSTPQVPDGAQNKAPEAPAQSASAAPKGTPRDAAPKATPNGAAKPPQPPAEEGRKAKNKAPKPSFAASAISMLKGGAVESVPAAARGDDQTNRRPRSQQGRAPVTA